MRTQLLCIIGVILLAVLPSFSQQAVILKARSAGEGFMGLPKWKPRSRAVTENDWVSFQELPSWISKYNKDNKSNFGVYLPSCVGFPPQNYIIQYFNKFTPETRVHSVFLYEANKLEPNFHQHIAKFKLNETWGLDFLLAMCERYTADFPDAPLENRREVFAIMTQLREMPEDIRLAKTAELKAIAQQKREAAQRERNQQIAVVLTFLDWFFDSSGTSPSSTSDGGSNVCSACSGKGRTFSWNCTTCAEGRSEICNSCGGTGRAN